MDSVMTKRFRAAMAVMIVLMLIIGMMPTGLLSTDVLADGQVTIYFDTYNNEYDDPKNGCNWTKNSQMYVYVTSQLADSSVYPKTNASTGYFYKMKYEPTLTSHGTGGRIYSITFSSSPSLLIFTSSAAWNGDYNQSIDVRSSGSGGGIAHNNVYYVTGRYSTTGDYYKRNVWKRTVSSDYKDWVVGGYAGRTFKLFNMSQNSAYIVMRFTNGNTSQDKYLYPSGSSFAESASQTTGQYSARTCYSDIAVPESSGDPFTEVYFYQSNAGNTIEFIDDSDHTKWIKKYVFSEGKIIGKTFYYGVTFFNNTAPLSYGNGKVLCYWDENRDAVSSGTRKLYLDDTFAAGVTGGKVQGSGAEVGTQAITTEGNANYTTTGTVTTTDAQNGLMTVKFNGVDYNLFWSSDATDDLVTIKDNVAFMSGKYTVQSEEEEVDGEKYISVRADMYNYLYDNFNSYHYSYALQGSTTNSTFASLKGDAKRPYLAINEWLSNSAYGGTTYPMYLGQFWLPLENEYDESSKAYTSDTAAAQRAGHNNDAEKYYIAAQQTNGFYMNFGFGNKLNNFKWAANLAYRTKTQDSGTYYPYNAVVQGLVNEKLIDGKLMAPGSTTISIPYFDPSLWTSADTSTTQGTVQMKNYIDGYENLAFPFFERTAAQVIETGFADGYSANHMLTDTKEVYSGNYYVFDSRHYAVRIKNNGTLEKYGRDRNIVTDNYGSDGNGSTAGLFPFNGPSDGYNKSQALQYGFGVKYTINFYMNENGTIDGTPDGTPISFTFQGDDDVWVFIDDQLILDMGGAHKNALGEINFKNKMTYVSAVGSATDTSIQTVGKNGRMVDLTTTDVSDYLTTGPHTITMYYMERGMLNSNLYVMFNLPLSLTNFEVQEDTDFSNVNEAFRGATMKVSERDEFAYEISNLGTSAGKVYDSHYGLPTYEYVTRNNNDPYSATGNLSESTLLSGQTPVSVTSNTISYVDTGYVYFDAPSWWTNDGYVAGFYFFNTDTDKAKYVTAERIYSYTPALTRSGGSRWRAPYDGRYNAFLVVRANGTYNKEYSTTSGAWNDFTSHVTVIDSNQTNDLVLDIYNHNLVTQGDGKTSYWSNSRVTQSVTVSKQNKTAKIFSPGTSTDSKGYSHLVNSSGGSVSYRMIDMFAENTTASHVSGTANYDLNSTYVYRDTLSGGIIPLRYGQMASVSRQFQMGSQMKVTQLNTLYKPSGTPSSNTAYSQSGTRTVSKYYTTSIKSTSSGARSEFAGIYNGNEVKNIDADHVETMYVAPNNYGNNGIINLQEASGSDKTSGEEDVETHFNFSDPTNSKSTYVHLRQVFVNQPQVTDLMIQKSILEGDDYSAINSTFTFQITFSQIFGDTAGDTLFDASNLSCRKLTREGGSNVIPMTSVSKYTASFSLRLGDAIVIENIPVGTHYYVTEVGSTDTMYSLDPRSENMGSSAQTIELSASADGVRIYNARKTGMLDIRKLLYTQSGNAVTTDTHKFTISVGLTASEGVMLSNYSITARVGGTALTGDDISMITDPTNPGFVTLVLKVTPGDANTVRIEGIPFGTTYTVSEDLSGENNYVLRNAEHAGSVSYTNPFYDDDEKEIGNEADPLEVDMVTVENVKSMIVMPETGGTPLIFLFPFGIIALAGSAAALILYKRKLQLEAVNHQRGRD